MVDFRKALLLLAVLVFATGIASAQFNPLVCTANAGVPPIARAEGVAEEVGQVVIVCTGGKSTAWGVNIPTVNVQIFLNTAITSRLLTSSSLSEALLLIDEPAPGDQVLCAGGTVCTEVGWGSGIYYYANGPNTTRRNVFQAQQAGSNSVVWLGVPFDPPGTTPNRVFRLVNVRANANALGVSSTLIPTAINMFISISGTGSLALTNPQLTVAYIQPGLKFSATSKTWNQCMPPSSKPGYQFDLKFAELFGTAFRDNMTGDVTRQRQPGTIYNTESMFSNADVFNSGTTAYKAGIASAGTKLIARFSNVPANITIRVKNTPEVVGADTATPVTTDGSTAAADPDNAAYAIVALSGGAGAAVWEVTASNPASIVTFVFPVYVHYTANPLPGLGTATVTGNYAPTTTVFTASTSAPVPRFVDNPQSATTFTIAPCKTNLLFPYVTNAAGWDTGIAVSNTSADPFGTVPQRGPCTVYFYGSTAGGGAAPGSQTSGTINEGTQLLFTLSAGGNPGITAIAGGFTGYIIISCNFQMAHGYAFVSDLGSSKVAEGYLALVMDWDYAGSAGLARTSLTTVSEKFVH